MKVYLHDFRGIDGFSQQYKAMETWPMFEFQGQEIEFVHDVALDFFLERVGSDLRLTGSVLAVLRLGCSRCAEKFDHPITVTVSEHIPLDRDEDPDEQWGSSYLDGELDELDLSEYALLSILERLPLQPLCADDCRGLCPLCGQNLNQGTCSCRDEQVDPRLAVLSKLLKHDPE